MENKHDKISIEVEINAAGQQQLNQYKNAFDGLKRSINDLSNPINKLDGDIRKLNDSINETKTQNDSMVDSVIKVGNTFEALKTLYKSVNEGVKLLKISSASLQATLTGGLSIIVAFLPEIINWIKELAKGNTTLSALNQTLKDTKIVTEAVNQVRLQGTQNAQQELVHLKLLYKATKDKNVSEQDRKKILGELQSLYPGYFDKMTTEKMMNGQAAQSYNELTKSIIANSRARAAENVMVKNQERSIGNTNNITKLKADLAEYNKQLIEAKNAAEIVRKNYNAIGGVSYADSKTKELANKAGELTKQRDATQKLINNLYTDSTLLNRQNDALAKTVAEDTERYGAKTLGINPITYSTQLDGSSRKGKKKSTRDDKIVSHDSPFEDVKLDMSPVKASLDQGELDALNVQKKILLDHTHQTQKSIFDVEAEYARKKSGIEDQLVSSKIHAGDKFIDAALKNSKKDSAIFKTAFLAKKATAIADTVISTKRAVIESLKAYAGIPFIGQALGIAQAVFMGTQGASSIAEIAKQKPGFAEGGQFRSDGRGALLPGYSRTDNTNAYLRSGEAVVVSEAMRNPWARNLVSAINVAHGGRDFSVTNPGRGYAIGGIFTDGGNSNRYYNQPMNDQKDLANTIAYQMINNFPPVYVDVKDINSQQSILAQTVNRVNL
jgi:archaellum component FlaC